MIEIVANDRNFNVFPVGTYHNKILDFSIPHEVLENKVTKEEDYMIIKIYDSDYQINFKQLNKVKTSEYYLRRLN